MIKYGENCYLQGIDFYDNLPETFRSNAAISETYQKLDYTIFKCYSEYVGKGIMDTWQFIRRFGDPQFHVTRTCSYMVSYLETLQDEESYRKQHYLYMWIGDFYYKRRNDPSAPKALQNAIKNYEKDVELIPYFSRQPLPMSFPSLKRLIAIYERQKNYEKALTLAEMGVKFRIPLTYEYEEKLESLKKKSIK